MEHDEPDEFVEVRRRTFAELVTAVTESSSEDPLPARLCRRFVAAAAARGGAITLASTRPEHTTLSTTDDAAARLEDLQEVLGQGPGADAYDSGTLVAADLSRADDNRWPMFARAARDAFGPIHLRAFPMRAGGQVLGVVTVHDPASGPRAAALDEHGLALLADAIGAALARESHDAQDGPPWGARDRIHQATGMVVAQLAITPDDALALMRAFAFSHEMDLQTVAEEILHRRQNFRENANYRGEA